MVVKIFADALLRIILAPDGKSLRENEKFIVAVHNNTDINAKTPAARAGDLTAAAFLKSSGSERLAEGAYHDQAEGVYLSNTEDDTDNFIYLSTPAYIGFFAGKGFNVVVQKSLPRLDSKKCTVDDGSLSIYAARLQIPYINLEADGINGASRQKEMIKAVYELLSEQSRIEAETVASGK